MTCVASLVTPRFAIMGHDSTASSDDLYVRSATPKVALLNGYLIGFAGSWSFGRRAFSAFESSRSLNEFLSSFEFPEEELALLVAKPGSLYEISTGGAVIEVLPEDDIVYHAIGTGAPYALGALYGDKYEAELSVTRALEAATAHSLSVRPPHRIFTLADRRN